jgi:hypothetical protein
MKAAVLAPDAAMLQSSIQVAAGAMVWGSALQAWDGGQDWPRPAAVEGQLLLLLMETQQIQLPGDASQALTDATRATHSCRAQQAATASSSQQLQLLEPGSGMASWLYERVHLSHVNHGPPAASADHSELGGHAAGQMGTVRTGTCNSHNPALHNGGYG